MTDESTNEPTLASESNEHHLRLFEKIKALPLTQQHLLEDLVNGLGEGTTKAQRQEAKNVVMAILGLVPQDVIFIQQIKQLPKDQQEDLHHFILEQLDPIPELETFASDTLLPSEQPSNKPSSDGHPLEPPPNMTEAETEELAQDAFGQTTFREATIPPHQDSEPSKQLQDGLPSGKEKEVSEGENLLLEKNNPAEGRPNNLNELEINHTESSAPSITEDKEKQVSESTEDQPIDSKISDKDSEETEETLSEPQAHQNKTTEEVKTEEKPQVDGHPADGGSAEGHPTDDLPEHLTEDLSKDREKRVEDQETQTEQESEGHPVENSRDEMTLSGNELHEITQSDNLIQIDVFGKGLMINTQNPIDGLEEAISQALGLKFRNVFGLLKSVDKNAFEILDQQLMDELVETGLIIDQVCYPVNFSGSN